MDYLPAIVAIYGLELRLSTVGCLQIRQLLPAVQLIDKVLLSWHKR
jgi:hypothetical protein